MHWRSVATRERGNPRLRFLDRTVGIPIVATAGLFRRPRPLPAEPARVGILNSTNIGDTVLLSAVVRDLVAAFPKSEVVFFAGSATLPLVRLIDGVRPVEISIAEPLGAMRTIRRERLDVVFDFDPWPRIEAIYSLVSGARFAAGFRTPRQHRHYCYDVTVDHSADVHELENYRRLVRAVGVDSSSVPTLAAPKLDAPSGQPYVVFHLWPSGYLSASKEWPEAHWRALAHEVIARDRAIVLTGSPADVERSCVFAASLGAVEDTVVDATGRYRLDELLGVLAGSECVVSVNTGVMHMAAAVGAATIGLNGPTAAHRWGPVGPRAVGVDSSFDGCGFLNLGWEYRGRRTDCMQGIEPERVLEHIVRILEDDPSPTLSPPGPRLR